MILFVILGQGLIMGAAMLIGMRQAYRQGKADGQLDASIAHMRLLIRQAAEREIQKRKDKQP